MRALGHARMAERHSDIEWRLDALMRTLERVEAGVSKARARAYVDRVDPQVRAIQKFFTHSSVSTLDRVSFQLTDMI